MLSQTVHLNQSSMGSYYKSIDMDDQDLLYFSKQQVESDQEKQKQNTSQMKAQYSWVTKLLELFCGRNILISKVLKQPSSQLGTHFKQKVVVFVFLGGYLMFSLIALYFGLGHFLVTLIVFVCICLYFSQLRQAKLERVLIECGSIAPEWSEAYRKLMKYIKQIEVVYAQIQLSNAQDFRALFTPKCGDEPANNLLRPRIACLEIRRLLITQIRTIQWHMIEFIKQSAEKHSDLKPKSNLIELSKFQYKAHDYYTLDDIKKFHSTLALLKYDIKQICTFLILNPKIPSLMAYQTIQDLKSIREAEIQSSRVLLAMLEAYQNHTQSKAIEEVSSNPKNQIMRYCKERTHLLNIYYNEYMNTHNQKLVGQALTQLKGIMLCLQGLLPKKKKCEVKPEEQAVEHGDLLPIINQEEGRVLNNKVYYLDEHGERMEVESAGNSQQVIEVLQTLLRNSQKGKKNKPEDQQPDQRIKFDFLGELKGVFGQAKNHVLE